MFIRVNPCPQKLRISVRSSESPLHGINWARKKRTSNAENRMGRAGDKKRKLISLGAIHFLILFLSNDSRHFLVASSCFGK